MGWAVLKQPNGKLAIFSTIVDDFLVLDATEAEIVEVFEDDARKSGRASATRALEGVGKTGTSSRCGRTWATALEEVRACHGDAVVALRARYVFHDLKTEEGAVDRRIGPIAKALDFAVRYGGIQGDHHKAWVIDQMVRALTGCPEVEASAVDCNGLPYTYTKQGESEEYLKLVAEAKAGEDGPNTYDWNEGITP